MRLLPDSQSPFPQAPASPPPRSRSPSHDAAVRPVEQGGGSGPGGAALTAELRESAHRRSPSLAAAQHPVRPALPPPIPAAQPRPRRAPRPARWRILSSLAAALLPNSATEVVADVLDKNTKNSHFLQNVGVKIRNCRSSLQNVQAQLEVERRTNVELQSIVNNQREAMNDLLKQMQETEQARIKDQEKNRKKQAVLEAKLELLLGQNRQS